MEREKERERASLEKLSEPLRELKLSENNADDSNVCWIGRWGDRHEFHVCATVLVCYGVADSSKLARTHTLYEFVSMYVGESRNS